MRYGTSEPELLFYKNDIFSVMENHRSGVRQTIQNMDGDRLLNTPTEDLVRYAVDRYSFQIPELLLNEAHVDQREEQVEVRDFGRTISVTGTLVELAIPFTGDKDFFFIKPTTSNSAPPRAIVSADTILVMVKGRGLTQDQVKSGLDSTIRDIQLYLSWQKANAEDFNRSLPQIARTEIEGRKAKLLKDRDLVAGLGFPMRQRSDAARTYAAPAVRRKIEPRLPPASTAPYKPEPVLDEAHFQHILGVIQNMTVVMERSPSAFTHMGEEALRDQILVQLNGHFEGAATGETFNNTGKTDILIRADGRNIFIGKCKFWRGEKVLTETVDQLLGYLSWRDTKAAVIIFNRNKDFSHVLTKICDTMDSYPHKKRGPVAEDETRFRYVCANPNDPGREIIVTILAFNIPNEPKT
jgi:hypothetical protein